MSLSRRQVFRAVAFFSAPAGAGAYLFLHRPAGYEAIKETVKVAFGPDILSDNDLERFAEDLAPYLGHYLSQDDLLAAAEWFKNLDREAIATGDQAALEFARAAAEEAPRRFARFVATHFVESTDFAYGPSAARVRYLGLFSEWPALSAFRCAPLVDYDADDGWPT
ncbi:MAG: hypothetical protein AAGC81_03330 [Pseudomonadota bacterium]